MSDGFILDPRLAADTCLVGDMALSRVLLMNDARYPWLVLVPRQSGLTEITDLSGTDAGLLMGEMRHAARALAEVCPHDKLNIGALGNVVRQLHIHILGRRQGDEAGAGPVWGKGSARPYTVEDKERLTHAFRVSLGL